MNCRMENMSTFLLLLKPYEGGEGMFEMVRKKATLIVAAVWLCLLLAACGSEETKGEKKPAKAESKTETKKTEDQNGAKENEEDMEVALTVEEIAAEEEGKYSGNRYNEAIVNRELDKQSFQDKDSFQVYNYLLSILNEGPAYKEYVKFFEDFNPKIETALTESPEGAEVNQSVTGGGQTNIAILLDASGSMAGKVGGKTKMETAKEAINKFVSSMPEGTNVSLRVYGHKGSNNDSDKKLSCDSTELLYDLKPYDEGDFKETLNTFQPTGWTPIAKAINETKADFEKVKGDGDNIIYVVSDGIETCDGDPAKAAKDLHDSNIKAVVNIIGFDVDNKGQKQLLAVAEAGGGSFETVDTAEQFNEIWEKERVRLYNEWSRWSAENFNEVAGESSDKLNELYSQKNKFANLSIDEKNRLSQAVSYLRNQEQIASETSDEVRSLIQQRRDIIGDYIDEDLKELIDEFEDESTRVKEEIQEKGQEKKDQYNNN
jgi:Ca-activated chloride channel family protein